MIKRIGQRVGLGIVLGVLLSILLPVESSWGMGTYSKSCEAGVEVTPTPKPTTTFPPPPKCPGLDGISARSPESDEGCPLKVVPDCKSYEITGGKYRELTRNWTVDRFLWKPRAEHYNGLAIVTLPRGRATSVRYGNIQRPHQWKKVPFRSVGDAGDAWADYANSGATIQRARGGVLVEIRGGNDNRRFLIECPSKRSDGLKR